MEDEWNWGLSETSKEEQLKEFEGKFGRFIERIATWPHVVVYDIDKASPYQEEHLKLIREYADRAYYRDDLGVGIRELELPVNKSSVQAEIDNMNSRRTPEQKKVSEDKIRDKLKTMLNTTEDRP